MQGAQQGTAPARGCGEARELGQEAQAHGWGLLQGTTLIGVIENEGGPFYGAFGQLKGPQAAEEPQGQKFRYYSEIYALHQHISCKIKKLI